MRRSEEKMEEDRLLRDSARRFFEEQRGWSQTGKHNGQAAYLDMGWPGMGLPDELGGMGADLSQCLMTVEEGGRVLLPDWLIDDVALTAGLAPLSGKGGMGDLLGQVPSGTVRFALVSGDRRHPPLRLAKNGMDATVTGRSGLVPDALRATHLLVCAENAEGEAQLAVIAGDAAGGVHREAYHLMDGRKAGILFFDGAAIPAGNVLASGEEARQRIAELTDLYAAGLVADCIGALDAGFSATIDHLKTRKQFGQPLSAFQAVQHLMADAYCDRENLRSLAIAMTAAFDGPAGERRKAVSAAKAYLGRNGLAAASRCIQVCGGIAMTEEYFVGHVYKRLQTAAALFGNAEDHLATLM